MVMMCSMTTAGTHQQSAEIADANHADANHADANTADETAALPTPTELSPRGRTRSIARELLRVGVILGAVYLIVGVMWGLSIPSLRSDGTYVAYPEGSWPEVNSWFWFVAATGAVGLLSGVLVGSRPLFATNPVSVFLVGVYSLGCTAASWFVGDLIASWRYPIPAEGQAGELSALLFISPGMALVFAPAMACLSMWIYLAIRYIQVGGDNT